VTLQAWGAFAFGLVIGWYVYYVNRYRKGDVQISDIVTLVGAIGGAAVLALFPTASDLFGAYGIGLAAGFFTYFLFLVFFVFLARPAFDTTWFLDGRRRKPDDPGKWLGVDDATPGRAMGGLGPGGVTRGN
jgi:predicted permease